MTRVLFVCLGNICRSPAAEGVLKKMVRDRNLEHRIFVDSAGTGDWHVGDLPDGRMRAAALERGYDLNSRARQITPDDLARFDWIITMDDSNFLNVRSLDPEGLAHDKIRKMVSFCRMHEVAEVPDPYHGAAEGFDLVMDILEDACAEFLCRLEDAPPHQPHARGGLK
jgi:protein-tyrosine phosphatase